MKREAFLGYSDEELLAGLFYGEARRKEQNRRDEVYEWTAIAQVVFNRVKAHGYPDTLQEVILQPHQFSCFNHGDANSDKIWMFLANKRPIMYYEQMMTKALDMIYLPPATDLVHGALHYIAEWFMKTLEKKKEEDPDFSHWALDMIETSKYGAHIFLK